MTTLDTTARLRLPLLQPGQAQKEMFHNEALALLDLVAQPVVVAVGVDEPPVAPEPGTCWVVGTVPTGVWAGHAHALAGWTAGGWRFVAAREGAAVWSVADGVAARFSGEGWTLGVVEARQVTVDGLRVVGPRRGAIADPGGGTVVDGEARFALAAVLATLRAHGLIAT